MKSCKKRLVHLEKDKGYFLIDVHQHYVASGTYLINKGILQNKNLQYHRCLNPGFKNTLKSVKIIAKLELCLPIDIEIDALLDEWKTMKLIQQKMEVNRIDSFWSTCIDVKEND